MLAAVSHAGGNHEQTPAPFLIYDAGNAYRNPDPERPGQLYLWPLGRG